MTLPDERYRAVRWAEQFLKDLCDPSKTPRVPRRIRDQARSILRHYPSQWDLDRAAAAAPQVFQERMEELHRFVLAAYEEKDPECTNTRGDTRE
jgi:hypothetical protein